MSPPPNGRVDDGDESPDGSTFHTLFFTVLLLVLVLLGLVPTILGIWLAIHLRVASPAHAVALLPALVTALLTREIRRRTRPGALPIRGLVPVSAAVGLVAMVSLVAAWTHLSLSALQVAWRSPPSMLPPPVFFGTLLFALFQGYLALIFFGPIPGALSDAARGALGRHAYGDPLPASEPELTALACTLGARSLALAHDASCSFRPGGVLVLGLGLLGAADARDLGALAAFAAARLRHGEPTRWRRIEAVIGSVVFSQTRHEFVFTPFSIWYWMLPAGHRLLGAAVAYAHAAAERAALAEMQAGDTPAPAGAYREGRSTFDAALRAQQGAATLLMRRIWTAITISEEPLHRLEKERAMPNLYRCEAAPRFAGHPVALGDLSRLTGLSLEACASLPADLPGEAQPAVALRLLDPYERELTRRILHDSLWPPRFRAMALGGEVDRSAL